MASTSDCYMTKNSCDPKHNARHMLKKFYRFPSKLNINGGAIGGDEAFLGGSSDFEICTRSCCPP